jgi:hypothetical protein
MVVPYWKKYCVMSPPCTLGPALPLSCALVPVTLLAGRVAAVGGTFVQYGLGGLIPLGQTMVARPGAAAIASAPAPKTAPTATSLLTCEYLLT